LPAPALNFHLAEMYRKILRKGFLSEKEENLSVDSAISNEELTLKKDLARPYDLSRGFSRH
jgi:hypothetical protein